MNPTLIIAGISALTSLIAVLTFLGNRRRAAMEEGARQQIIKQIRCDLDQAYAKIHDIETNLSTASGDMRELKTDVRHILNAIERLESKIDGRIEVGP